MGFRVKLNPADLQDRAGFLAFLEKNSRAGLAPVRVFRTFTLFRPSDCPPNRYTLSFFPQGAPQGKPEDLVPGTRQGVFLCPGARWEQPEADWLRAVTAHYDQFTGLSRFGFRQRVSACIGLPVLLIAFSMFLRFSGGGSALSQNLLTGSIALGVLSLLLLGLARGWNLLHHSGMTEALEEGKPYVPSSTLRRWTKVKNALYLLYPLPLVLLILVFLRRLLLS